MYTIGKLISALLAYPSALSFVFKNGLSKYFIISGAISLVLGAIAFSSVYYLSDDLGGIMMQWYPFDTGRDVVSKVATAISGISMTGISFVLYKYALLILVGPFMGPLSEQVEEIETGVPAKKQGLGQMGYAVFRGIGLALRNIIRELTWTILLLLLGLIPLLTPFTTAMIFLIQAYYMGCANMDYHLEKSMNMKQSINYCRNSKGSITGNGIGYILLLFIPFIGLILGPVLGTVAATRQALVKR